MHLPDAFVQRIAGAFGEAGIHWLADLPRLLDVVAALWRLRILPPFDLSYNYVAPVVLEDGSAAVLKLYVPGTSTEAAALEAFGGDAVCRLLDHLPEPGAILMERVQPGVPLTVLAMADDERATSIAIDLFQRVWQEPPPEHAFITVADRAAQLDDHRRRFDGGSGPLPEGLFQEAEEAFRELPAYGAGPQLLHGDLHHDNILSSDRASWLAIDPKGVVGDPGYDLGAFLYNPMPGLLAMSDPAQVIARRIDQLAEGLGLERFQVRGWGLAQAVLSCVWSIEDNLDFSHSLTCARHIAQIRV